jgi:hypothetical protein
MRFRPREAALPGSVTYLAQVAVIVENNAAMLYQRRVAVFTTSLDGNGYREVVAAVFLRRIRN